MNEGAARAIRIEAFLPHPIGEVWRALTEPELIERWLMPTDFRLGVGHKFRFRGVPITAVRFAGIVECEVLDFLLERKLSYRWRDPGHENGLDSTVTWLLEPVMGGTRLTLEHVGFDPDHPLQQLSRDFMKGGWVGVVKRLEEVVEGMAGGRESRTGA